MRNKYNKLTTTTCILLVFFLGYLITNFYFVTKGCEEDLDKWARQNNTLNVIRDFEILFAIQENNITKIEKNLELNLKFHLTGIEIDGLTNTLDIKNLNKVCETYIKIKENFENDYKNKYPFSIKSLDSTCKIEMSEVKGR